MLVDAELAKEIREACIRLLTRREHSQRELQNKLLAKGFDPSVTQSIIDGLAEEGWQSDERFAESYTRYRIRKGFGPVKISFELWKKGVERFDLDPVVLDLDENWFDLLAQVYNKKYTDNTICNQKEWQKCSRFLIQRGFSHEMVNAFLKTR